MQAGREGIIKLYLISHLAALANYSMFFFPFLFSYYLTVLNIRRTPRMHFTVMLFTTRLTPSMLRKEAPKLQRTIFLEVKGGEERVIRCRLTVAKDASKKPFDDEFEKIFSARKNEADIFYNGVIPGWFPCEYISCDCIYMYCM